MGLCGEDREEVGDFVESSGFVFLLLWQLMEQVVGVTGSAY